LKPALSEFQTILATTPAAQPVSREESETLLNQFVQWQQQPAPATKP